MSRRPAGRGTGLLSLALAVLAASCFCGVQSASRQLRASESVGRQLKSSSEGLSLPVTKLPVYPRHPQPPPKVGNVVYCAAQCFNDKYVNWVRSEIRPLVYMTEARAFEQNWEPFLDSSTEKPDPAEIVILTQTTPERLPQVRRMMHAWQGPISMALFIPYAYGDPRAEDCRNRLLSYVANSAKGYPGGVAASLLYALEEAHNNHCNITEESTGHEPPHFDLNLWNSRYKNGVYIDIWDGEYPVNNLRNLAKQQIQTDVLVYVVDSDMSPNRGAYQDMKYGNLRKHLIEMRTVWEERQEIRVIIVPTFERTEEKKIPANKAASTCVSDDSECWMYEAYDIPWTRKKLLQMNSENSVIPFYWTRWQRGHRCWKPVQWLNYTSDEPYETPYMGGCEPYTINLNRNMADYDERYRGRYYDKVSQVQHMALLGAKFFVDPHNFLVHVPHPQTVYSFTLIDWYPANQDQLCVTNTLLHIHANEVSAERNTRHHYSRIAASQLVAMGDLGEVRDAVVPPLEQALNSSRA